MTFPLLRTFQSPLLFSAALCSELATPLLRLALSGISPPTPLPLWRKGLLVGANHIGDLLYRTVALRELKEGLPDCEWHVLASPPANQVLIGNPYLTKIQPFDLPHSKQSTEFRILAAEQYDVVICYNTGQYFPYLKLAIDLKVPNRVFYSHKGFSAWVTHPVPIRFPQAFPAYFRDLVSHISGKPNLTPLRPQIFLNENDLFEAERFLKNCGITPPNKILACFVTSRQPNGVWPAKKYAEALQLVEAQFPTLRTLLLGAPTDQELLQGLKMQFGLRAPIFAGQLSLRGLVALLSKCDSVLTTDSGPRHLANAAGTVPVFFRNLWFNSIEAGRYLDEEFDFAPADIGEISPNNQEFAFEQVSPATVARLLSNIISDHFMAEHSNISSHEH